MIALWVAAGSGLEAALLAVFVAAAALLFYTYVGYPALLAVIAAFRRRALPEPGYTPSISVLIAAYNEEAHIGRKIEQTLALEYPAEKLEVVVVSDGSSDRTDEVVEAFADPRVRLLRVPRGGKTQAQNEAVRHCRGDIVVFSDATTVYHRQALSYLACNYVDPSVGAVSGRYQYFDPEGDSPTGLGSIAFWNYENLIKTFQSRIRTLTGCSGCIYSVRRELYAPLPREACSDLIEPLWIVGKSYRVVFEPRALAYEETTRSAGDEFGMRVRVVTQGMQGLLSTRSIPGLWDRPWIAFQLLSHKAMRWMVPLFLAMLAAASAALAYRPEFLILFALQAAFYGFALLSVVAPLHRRWKLLGLPLYFCTLNAAALVSLVELARGRKYALWETVRR